MDLKKNENTIPLQIAFIVSSTKFMLFPLKMSQKMREEVSRLLNKECENSLNIRLHALILISKIRHLHLYTKYD